MSIRYFSFIGNNPCGRVFKKYTIIIDLPTKYYCRKNCMIYYVDTTLLDAGVLVFGTHYKGTYGL